MSRCETCGQAEDFLTFAEETSEFYELGKDAALSPFKQLGGYLLEKAAALYNRSLDTSLTEEEYQDANGGYEALLGALTVYISARKPEGQEFTPGPFALAYNTVQEYAKARR
jgi:hypothetical protein